MEEEVNISSENPQMHKEKVNQEQIQDLLFGEKLSWQSIIYDLINTEQLDPWDIDISLLANKYIEKIRQLEEANFFVSSKVLLAAALLLRIKSEILLERDLPTLEDSLFGKKEEPKKYVQGRIDLDEDIPELIPRTPLPRYKKVTLQELMSALSKAIKTETRRIKRVVLIKQQEIETALSLPKQKINLQERIKEVYQQLTQIFSKRETKLPFSEISGETTEQKIATFIPLLHLDNQQKVWLEQEGHLEEIWIWLKTLYEKKNADKLAQMMNEVEEAMKEFNDQENEALMKRKAETAMNNESDEDSENIDEEEYEEENKNSMFKDRRPRDESEEEE